MREVELVDRADPEPDPARLAVASATWLAPTRGHVRIGVEFVDLSDLEGRLLAMLFRRDERRHPRASAPTSGAPTRSST